MATKSLSPATVTTNPGGRVVFQFLDGSTPVPIGNGDYEVLVYFPGEMEENGPIDVDDDTFSWVAPPNAGTNTIQVLVKNNSTDQEWWVTFEATINPAQAPVITSTNSMSNLTPPVYMDFYDPTGELMYSEDVSASGPNYSATIRPDLDWKSGEYLIYLRDSNGVQDIDSQWIERPRLISMPIYYGLPVWQRHVLSYLKYEMMGDCVPLHPGALLTLEEYATHWMYVVQEINDIPPYTNYQAPGVPYFWSNVMVKGTLCRVYHSLSNRSVTIPRWAGVSVPMQDRSHYQGAWETRYQMLREEYKEERAYLKGHHLPGPSVTVDPWLGWGGGNMAGTAGLALIGRPTWFTRNWSSTGM